MCTWAMRQILSVCAIIAAPGVAGYREPALGGTLRADASESLEHEISVGGSVDRAMLASAHRQCLTGNTTEKVRNAPQ